MPATTAPAASANAPALDPALCGSSRVSESQGGSVFPSILATNYQPSAAEQPGLCLSFEDVDQLPKAAQDPGACARLRRPGRAGAIHDSR
jgi:hypothetical protein